MVKGKPMPFIIVLVVALALTIFFGAWAVSTDLEGGNPAFAIGAETSVSTGTESETKGVLSDSVTSDGVDTDQQWWQSAIIDRLSFTLNLN